MTSLPINVPFPGFYHSNLASIVDHEEEQLCDNRVEDGSNEGDESSYPEELRLTVSEFGEALWHSNAVNYPTAFLSLAKDYLAQYEELASDDLGFPLGLEFEKTDSPKEYNFTTDRLFALIPHSSIAKLHELAFAPPNRLHLTSTIRDRHESRDGFASFYPCDLPTWEAKRLDDYDHNELQTLIIAALPPTCAEALQDEAERNVAEYWGGNGEFDEHLDYDKLEAALADTRAEKLAAIPYPASILARLAASYPEGYDHLTAAIERRRVAA
jgi:hypothetical protein